MRGWDSHMSKLAPTCHYEARVLPAVTNPGEMCQYSSAALHGSHACPCRFGDRDVRRARRGSMRSQSERGTQNFAIFCYPTAERYRPVWNSPGLLPLYLGMTHPQARNGPDVTA